ncbi:MAG: hypothetical protein MRY77_02260 [Rhodobacteraceae bacterium]|nr:hypothetical protein [Paracoccaceae bacterium]
MPQLNQYAVTLKDGRVFTVNTPNHHANHSDAEFKDHLLDVLKQTVAGVIAVGIGGILFKGKV